MKPTIDQTAFGSITIEGETFERDVFIRLDGRVKQRKKKLSKAATGTSHLLSRDEAKYVLESGCDRLIVGTGQHGMLKLSDEATGHLKRKKCRVDLLPTPDAIHAWNQADGAVIGLFHVTC